MITNPVIVNFSAEQLRPAADALETAALALETLVARYDDWEIGKAVSGLTADEMMDTIDDRATEEGRPKYIPAYMANFINNARGMIEQFNAPIPNGNGMTLRKQLRYMATNPKNPLLK